MALTTDEAESIAAICLLAAMADGTTQDDERARLERVFTLVDDGAHAGVYQRVVMGQTDVAAEAAKLSSAPARTMAYEMAVGVCEADGKTSAVERAFLGNLETALGVDHDHAVEVVEQGDELAEGLLDDGDDAGEPSAVASPPPLPKAAGLSGASAGAESTPDVAGAGSLAAGTGAGAGAGADQPLAESTTARSGSIDTAAEREVDSMVLKYSILNGAIELLPQDLATVAILPLQMKMVYRIGKRFGYQLSRGHIKEFLGVLGVGMSSQILEGYARKLFGKVAKKALGKTAGSLAKTATGPMMTFATTYALGQVAKQYYGGGRTLSAVDLKGTFQRSVSEGQRVYAQQQGRVQREAGGLNVSKVIGMVRGKGAV